MRRRSSCIKRRAAKLDTVLKISYNRFTMFLQRLRGTRHVYQSARCHKSSKVALARNRRNRCMKQNSLIIEAAFKLSQSHARTPAQAPRGKAFLCKNSLCDCSSKIAVVRNRRSGYIKRSAVMPETAFEIFLSHSYMSLQPPRGKALVCQNSLCDCSSKVALARNRRNGYTKRGAEMPETAFEIS